MSAAVATADRVDPRAGALKRGLRTTVVPADLKATRDRDGVVRTLEGLASTFDNVDLQGDVIRAGAFRDSLARRLPRGDILLLDSHIADAAHVLGTVVEARETSAGLAIRANVSATAGAQETLAKVAEGHVKRLSIGYSPRRWGWTEIDGKQARELLEVELYEVSVVPFPANPQTSVTRVKSPEWEAARAALAVGRDLADRVGRRDDRADARLMGEIERWLALLSDDPREHAAALDPIGTAVAGRPAPPSAEDREALHNLTLAIAELEHHTAGGRHHPSRASAWAEVEAKEREALRLLGERDPRKNARGRELLRRAREQGDRILAAR